MFFFHKNKSSINEILDKIIFYKFIKKLKK